MFVATFVLPVSFFICFGMYSTPKLVNYVTLSRFTYKAIQQVPIDLYSSRFITYAPYFICAMHFGITGHLFLK